MDRGAAGTAATHSPEPATAEAAPRARRRLALELSALAVVGVLLIAALAAGAVSVYQAFYSPTAFVERYLGLLATGRAADALAVPGVAVDSSELAAAGLPESASDALLRSAVLRSLTGVHTVSEAEQDGIVRVTVQYTAGTYPGSTVFEVESAGWVGAAPVWRFARSPLSVIELDVTGSMSFSVNGFEVDKRQVSTQGTDADPGALLPMLVFSPGVYAVEIDTSLATSDAIPVLADAPLASVSVAVQAQPTENFVEVVQDRVDTFVSDCADQRVLQPSGCPFGFVVQNRIEEPPVWSIVSTPTISLEPDGDSWRIPPAEGTAHIVVRIRSLFDGSVRQVEEDVPFALAGQIAVQPDGSVSITVSGVGD